MSSPLVNEAQAFYQDRWQAQDAELKYQLVKSGVSVGSGAPANQQQKSTTSSSSLVSEIAKARAHIQNSLKNEGGSDNVIVSRMEALELDNKDLRQVTKDLQVVVKKLESRIAALEASGGSPKKVEAPVSKQQEKGESDDDDDDDDDDFDMFSDGGDDEAEAEKEKIRQERLDSYYAKKSTKKTVIAKSNVILDVKPWGDDTDMVAMEKAVRSIEMDGLLWGTAKLVPVGYGIKKLTISTVVEDDKVGIDELSELIQEFEDYVQSVDVAAFNKL